MNIYALPSVEVGSGPIILHCIMTLVYPPIPPHTRKILHLYIVLLFYIDTIVRGYYASREYENAMGGKRFN